MGPGEVESSVVNSELSIVNGELAGYSSWFFETSLVDYSL
jgi:hypothetical protein